MDVQKPLTKVNIYTDGACSGNPGPGGWACILECGPNRKELSDFMPATTNNRMEMLAVISGLGALKRPCDVTVYSDSNYVVQAFNDHWIDSWIKKGWKRGQNEDVKNVDLWKRLLAAKKQHRVTFCWVKGHAGHPENERCDVLATTAADHHAVLDDVVGE